MTSRPNLYRTPPNDSVGSACAPWLLEGEPTIQKGGNKTQEHKRIRETMVASNWPEEDLEMSQEVLESLQDEVHSALKTTLSKNEFKG
mmetsp:Transcript_12096/g.23124  ORF Transcript_12096/g.23124 Transcript_12096/m.23124 type:complete len:88 (+) Transcript_12096:197-460(+)